jgi:putative membrane protein
MKIYSLILFSSFSASAMFLTSCNSNDAVKQADAANQHSPSMVSANKVNSDDAEFVTAAVNGGLLEIELGKLCAEQTKNTAVQSFGAMMVDDHTGTNNELQTIAANRNLVLPVVMSNKDQKMVDDMRKKSGSDFDKAYINMMVSDHEEDMNAFKKESTGGKDADISSFAARTLPMLQKHLDAAKAAQKVI